MVKASTARESALGVRAFRRGCGGPGGVSRQYPSSMAFIQGSVIYLRTTVRANLQTAAFATSTIVQMKPPLDKVFILR
jgi:hypothetical protein